jgi:hypothetical protein
MRRGPLCLERGPMSIVRGSTLCIWVFNAKFTDEFVLGLDILRAYMEAVDLRHVIMASLDTTMTSNDVILV